METINHFEFSTAERIIFGAGTIKEIGPIAASLGHHALIVGGQAKERAAGLINILDEVEIFTSFYQVTNEPTVSMVIQGMGVARQAGCDLVIGMGGGSSLDTAKAIAILLANPGDIYDYLEVIGKGHQFERPPLPIIAIPTTAGTGTEVTKNAVIGVPEQNVKVSLRHTWLLPKIALIDPELTYTCSPQTTAFSGMDALTQLIEPFTSPKANPLIDSVCQDGIARSARSLQTAYQNGNSSSARADLALASLYGGIALANAGLGVVHGFSGVMGGMYSIPHGALCARILPFAMDTNITALRKRDQYNPALAKYEIIAKHLTGNEKANASDGFRCTRDLIEDLQIPPLAKYGVKREDFSRIVSLSRRASSMKNNIIGLTDDELIGILELAY